MSVETLNGKGAFVPAEVFIYQPLFTKKWMSDPKWEGLSYKVYRTNESLRKKLVNIVAHNWPEMSTTREKGHQMLHVIATVAQGRLGLSLSDNIYNSPIKLPGHRGIASCCCKIASRITKMAYQKNVVYFQAFEMSHSWAPIYLSYIATLQIASKSYRAIFHNKNTFLTAILVQ